VRPGSAPADRKQIYVFVEGDTERDYLDHWHRRFRDDVHVAIDKCRGSPLRLVSEAVKQRSHDLAEEKRGRGRARDEYWCVFDRDEHQDFNDAITEAATGNVRVAFSNPCLELWFVLHSRDQTAWIHRDDVQRESKRILKCGKNLTSQALESLDGTFDDARRRARQLDLWHEGNGSPPRSNPSSSMWELIERIAGGV